MKLTFKGVPTKKDMQKHKDMFQDLPDECEACGAPMGKEEIRKKGALCDKCVAWSKKYHKKLTKGSVTEKIEKYLSEAEVKTPEQMGYKVIKVVGKRLYMCDKDDEEENDVEIWETGAEHKLSPGPKSVVQYKGKKYVMLQKAD